MIEVERPGPQIGAEIRGVDVTTLDDATFAVAYRAWLDCTVAVVPDQELTDRMIQPGAEYRHRWRKGDVVIRDNRCSYHKAAGDYPPEEDRIPWRVSIKERAGGTRVAAA
jgi:alpha-ketoglutarate-dependent taurine dioxygenase